MFYRKAPGTGTTTTSYASGAAARAGSRANKATARVGELEEELERVKLLNQALWEILQRELGISDEELVAVAQEIDLRDGQEDGKISGHPVRCPTCGRVSHSKHYKCMYCGQLFEKPVFG